MFPFLRYSSKAFTRTYTLCAIMAIMTSNTDNLGLSEYQAILCSVGFYITKALIMVNVNKVSHVMSLCQQNEQSAGERLTY